MALLLVAAAAEHQTGFERLKAMPAAERDRLLAALRRFDLELTPEQQAAARELDRRLAEMSPERRDQYLAVLRRYHAWLNSLPEQRQNQLTERPPSDRMAMVRTLIKDRPVPTGETPTGLRVIEPGEYNPFEVASAYRIWRELNDKQRSDLEKMSPERARRESLFRIGERTKIGIPRETVPADFDEAEWSERVRKLWGGLRPIMLMEDAAKTKFAEAVKKRAEAVRPEFGRRQAINLYVSQTQVPSVDPDRLTRFMAELPPWIPASFHSMPPDEARRRMTFAYRLVFPKGEEIGAARKGGAATKGTRPAAPRPGASPKPKARSTEAGENPAPF